MLTLEKHKTMKLSERKLEKKNDNIAFKALLRSIKESKNCYSYVIKRYKSLGEIISKCYLSRETHPNEEYYTNISYWPDDIGLSFDSPTKFFYLSLIITSVKGRVPADLKKRFEERFQNMVATLNLRYVFIESNYKMFEKAFVKCGHSNEDSQEKIKTIELIKKGLDEKIPF